MLVNNRIAGKIVLSVIISGVAGTGLAADARPEVLPRAVAEGGRSDPVDSDHAEAGVPFDPLLDPRCRVLPARSTTGSPSPDRSNATWPSSS